MRSHDAYSDWYFVPLKLGGWPSFTHFVDALHDTYRSAHIYLIRHLFSVHRFAVFRLIILPRRSACAMKCRWCGRPTGMVFHTSVG